MKWETFWAGVDKTPGKCWNWTGRQGLDGYGKVKYYLKNCKPHQLAAYLAGLVPSPYLDTHQITHTCGNKLCCNIAHMRVVKKEVRKPVHGNQKLSQTVANKIRYERNKGALLQDLAVKYGVSHNTISRVCRKLVY